MNDYLGISFAESRVSRVYSFFLWLHCYFLCRYCALVPILPHLGGPPELVFGNVAGIKVRVSDKLMLPPGCSSSGLTPRPAPQTGNWFVLVTEPGGKR